MVEQRRDASSTSDRDGHGAGLSLGVLLAGFLMVMGACPMASSGEGKRIWLRFSPVGIFVLLRVVSVSSPGTCQGMETLYPGPVMLSLGSPACPPAPQSHSGGCESSVLPRLSSRSGGRREAEQ